MCELAPSEMVTLTVTVVQPPGLGDYAAGGPDPLPLYVWANVTYGGGSTSATRKIRIDDYLSVPLVLAYLSVSPYIGDVAGNPVQTQPFNNPTPPSAQVNVQVARGVRGIPGQATIFVTGEGSNFSLYPSPCRVASLSAHLTTTEGADRYLQLFDRAPGAVPVPDGTVPTAEYALGQAPYESDIGDILRYLNPRGFGQGIQVAVSNTSGILAGAGAGSVWIEAEIVQL